MDEILLKSRKTSSQNHVSKFRLAAESYVALTYLLWYPVFTINTVIKIWRVVYHVSFAWKMLVHSKSSSFLTT